MDSKIHQGKVAIISGGLGDIAMAIVKKLVSQGAVVAISDILSEEKAESLIEPLRKMGAHLDYRRVDVSEAAAVQAWVQSVSTRLGVPSLIIPNAAIVEEASSLNTTEESFSRHLQINLLGSFFMAQEAAKRLVEAKEPGRIVFIGSWAAHAAHPQILPYSVTKAALRMAMQCMALDLAASKIMVNEVAPGFVDAGLSAKEFQRTPGLRERCEGKVPTGNLLTAEAVAEKVAFLMHPEASEITGVHLVVDGGVSLVSPGSY